MHIIALEDDPSSLRGGQELNLLEICRGLSQRGHSICLLYVNKGNLLERYQEFCTQIEHVNSYKLDRSKITDIFGFLADVLKIPASQDSVIFSKQYYDVFFGSALSLAKNIPFVCYLQLPPLEKKFTRPHAVGLKGVKQFVVVSEQTKQDWLNRGFKEEKIDLVYNGTNPEIFQPSDFPLVRKEWNIPESVKVISYVGRLDKEKGLETLIKAFALLIKTGSSARLLIAGKPVTQGEEYKKSLEQLVTDLSIEKDVDFLGYVANTAFVYQVSDATVLPSLWSEPFGRTVIESMACGTPVVASRTGGIPEILTGEFQSSLFETGNERDLADTINRVINWRDKDPQLGERCREHVLAKFTLDKMVDGIEKVLLKVIRNP